MRRRRPVSKADTVPRSTDPRDSVTSLQVLEQPNRRAVQSDHAQGTMGSLESMFREISVRDANVLGLGEHPGQTDGKYDDLWQLSLADPLTGLANRMLLLDRLTRELTRRQRHGGCVIVSHIDLDNLKDINDEFGYSSGNEVLRGMSRRLTAMLRCEDTVSRVSETELVAVMTIEDEQYVEPLMDRVRTVLHDPISVTGRNVYMATTLATVMARNSESAEQVLARVGQAA
jgi:diguanylate cyclase (GGDEF)-like protein